MKTKQDMRVKEANALSQESKHKNKNKNNKSDSDNKTINAKNNKIVIADISQEGLNSQKGN